MGRQAEDGSAADADVAGGRLDEASADGVAVRLDAGFRVLGPPGAAVPGQPVRVMIRPEALSLRDGGGAGGNTMEGVVEEALYLGQAVRYSVRVGAVALTVREPHRTAEPTVPRQARVTVSWPRTATTLVAAGGEPA